MEPAEKPLKVTLTVPIIKIEEKFLDHNHRNIDGRHTFDQHSLGWFIQFQGSNESIKLFDETPPWKVGDVVEISFRKKP